MSTPQIISVPVDRASAQIEEILKAWGMEEQIIRDTVNVMIETDLSGVDSHGISQLHMYSLLKAANKLNTSARPRVVSDFGAVARVDGDAGLGHPCGVYCMRLAIQKAREFGIGIVSACNSHHFGAAGYYARMASDEKMLGMVTSSTRYVAVVPPRGTEPVLGTNPIAISAPGNANPPVTLDIATSVTAIGKVRVHSLQEKPLPNGWVVDKAGKAVQDASEGYRIITEDDEGGLCTLGGSDEVLGGHKGYGLSMFAHILASTLSGGSFSPVRNRTQRDDEPDNIGHFFFAIDISRIRPSAEFGADLDDMIDVLRNNKPVEPSRPVLIPGDPERSTRAQRLSDGIPMHRNLRARIREIAEEANAPYLLE